MNETLNFLKSQIGQDASKSPSPVMRWLNPTIIHAEEGEVHLELKVRKEFCNPLDQLHGGISASIIDDAIGVALYSYGDGVFHSSINLSVDYFSGIQVGHVVNIKAKVLKKGRRLSNAVCEIFHKDSNRLVARGTSNLINGQA
ncbi:MAG: PaaI family thioesterase [Bacteroidia bacterium]|nr:PaaI family thioesterase [Bacteroidia bacterium]